MSSLEDHYAFRAQLLGRLRGDLLGPRSEDEVIQDEPATQYALGVLFPTDSGYVDDDQQEDDPEDGDETTHAPDPPVAMAGSRYPSSMGMTFAVDPETASEIRISVEAARYEEVEAGGSKGWRRRPLDLPVPPLDVSAPLVDELELGEGLALFRRVRSADADGIVSVTLALVNRRKDSGYPRDPDCFFQAEIRVVAADGAVPFVQRSSTAPIAGDLELESYRLLYRHAGSFAVGHGCSVGWDAEPSAGRASSVWTDYAPECEVPVHKSNPDIELDVLSLACLASEDRTTVIAGLEALCDGYERWLLEREGEVAGLEGDFAATGRRHLEECANALRRMRNGVALLRDDEPAWKAFRLANQAMLSQRARASWLRDGKPDEGPRYDDSHEWRPFQLAFILLCIAGIVDREGEDRKLVDLLWFPTGGGKTEAYLGLIAFTLFLRRLRDGDRGDGVASLMRYTLRLLTIQQFERAALLICCCEALRQEDPGLGTEPFLLGLWVGRGGAPNTLDAAGTALERLRSRQPVEEGNPIQLQQCPWCGTRLSAFDYRVERHGPRMRITCPTAKKSDGSCGFVDLPVVIVDEELYRRRPSLVIATADKFASLPWKGEVGRLFGIGTQSPPPELIVQDELHLISGPLGTLTGLYETAVDLLCSEGGIGPKVIASTATIRRADRQTLGLFAREMRQFPPPALDARDSYFARESSPSESAARRYVGLLSPSVSHATLMIRTYAILLQAALEIDAPDDVKDPYWTLVGYFNSLRVLGGARMQVQDDVADRISYLAGEGRKRRLDERIELTSREPSDMIPDHLAHMQERLPEEEVLDVILATNMISVGIDIDRLGLMAVMGQPQSTSEYIQATSRVGRSHPGLIATIFNASRSRDRSHYESFVAYHSGLYRQVESTSVTPFSPRARDRALHAVLIALARQMVVGMRDNDGAARIGDESEAIALLKGKILERVRIVAPAELESTERQLAAIEELWRHRAEREPRLLFNQPRQLHRALLIDAARADRDEGLLPTPWSLRDVDRESNLYPVG